MNNKNKIYNMGAYYHIYNRALNYESLFYSEDDYNKLIGLLDRYLLPQNNLKYKNYYNKIELLSFCLMPTHFHLLVCQSYKYEICQFMHSLQVAYAKSLNHKNKRFGYLFQNRYGARLIENEEDLINISRYIHLNPNQKINKCLSYYFSSIGSFIEKSNNVYEFVKPEKILSLFNFSKNKYLNFLNRV